MADTQSDSLTLTDGPSHILLDSAYFSWKMVRYATVDLIFPSTCVERGDKTEFAVYCVFPDGRDICRCHGRQDRTRILGPLGTSGRFTIIPLPKPSCHMWYLGLKNAEIGSICQAIKIRTRMRIPETGTASFSYGLLRLWLITGLHMIIEIQPKERRPSAMSIQGNSSICSVKNAIINDRGSWKGLVRHWSLNEDEVEMTYKHYGDNGEHHQRPALTRCLYRLLEYELALGRAYLGLLTREFRFLYAGKLLF